MHLAKIKFVEAILCLPEFLHTFGEDKEGVKDAGSSPTFARVARNDE